MAQSLEASHDLDAEPVKSVIQAALHDYWLMFLFEGVALIALGAAAVAVPTMATFATTVVIGWLLCVGGGIGLIATILARHMKGFWWALLSSVLALITGAALLWMPVSGALSLTIILGAFFLADGLTSIMLAFNHRKDVSRSWGWLVASGFADILLAALIISGWPGTAAWVIGLIVGIDLAFGGLALIMVALKAHRQPA
jgi:uncharacterized membrane protein HdeD (DUF308 family)